MGNAPPGAGGQPSASAAGGSTSYTQTQANGTGTAVQARKPAQSKVLLNVYEPAKPQFSMPGFGIYHTGIEFNNVEYTFAGSPEASGTGVQSQVPRATPADAQWKYKQTIELGVISVTNADFDRVLRELQDAFPANTYDLLHRNCNSFTTAVAKRLGVEKNYPSWVNRAANWGAAFSGPPKGMQPLPEQKPAVSVFQSTTGYRMDGGTVAPKVKGAGAAAAPAAAAPKGEAKTAEKAEQKGSSAAAGAGKGGRRNPWADPNFVPPQMRKDPVVATGRIDA